MRAQMLGFSRVW